MSGVVLQIDATLRHLLLAEWDLIHTARTRPGLVPEVIQMPRSLVFSCFTFRRVFEDVSRASRIIVHIFIGHLRSNHISIYCHWLGSYRDELWLDRGCSTRAYQQLHWTL